MLFCKKLEQHTFYRYSKTLNTFYFSIKTRKNVNEEIVEIRSLYHSDHLYSDYDRSVWMAAINYSGPI